MAGCRMIVQDGATTSFLKDNQYKGKVLVDTLFIQNYSPNEDCSVQATMENLQHLVQHKMEDQPLREEIQRFAIQNGNDILIWSFTNSGKFSIKSTYSYIKRQVAGPDLVFSKIWYQCFPPRASLFYWKILNQFMFIVKSK